MAADKSYNDLKSRLVLRSIGFGLLVFFCTLIMLFSTLSVPMRIADEGALGKAMRGLAFITACDVTAGLLALGAVYLWLDTFAMLIRNKRSSVKVYKLIQDPYNPHLKPDKKPAFLILRYVLGYTATLALAGVAVVFLFCFSHSFMSTAEGDMGVMHITGELMKVALDDKAQATCTEYIEDFAPEGYEVTVFGKIKTGESRYYLTTMDGKKIPLTSLDKTVLTKFDEAHKRQKKSLMKLEYYKHSGIVKSYSFIEDRREIDSFDKPQVEITLGEGFAVTRPEDMEDYGEIAWAVTRNGELVLPDDIDYDRPYSVSAAESATLRLLENGELFDDSVKGEYAVTLVKVFLYADPSGNLPPDEEAVPISNTVTFTIAGGNDVIKALGGEKLKLNVDEKNFKVTFPELPDGYTKYLDIYLAAELSGALLEPVYGSNTKTESYPYEQGKTFELPIHSAHYRVYAYVLDDDGKEAVISEVAEFDYMSDEDKKKEEQRLKTLEYFEPVMQALEKHDTKAIKAMLSKATVGYNGKYLDEKLESLCDVYKGGNIKRDEILYPYVSEYNDADGKYSELMGDVWLTTDTGCEYHLWVQTCLKNERNKDEIGVTYISLSDSLSYDVVTIS